MNNAEKWKDKIREFKGNIAIVGGELRYCPDTPCDTCDFYDVSCPNKICIWLCEESDE